MHRDDDPIQTFILCTSVGRMYSARSACIAAVWVLAACGQPQATTPPSPAPQTPGPLADTWAWDGSIWHRAAQGPSARYFASLAYDAQRHVFVLFGGQTAHGASDETWTWDGLKWNSMSPAHRPPARREAAMAYDPTHQVVVLYGGSLAAQAEGGSGSDTWTWDGSDWTQASASNEAPGPRRGSVMVTAGNRVLLFGGAQFANDGYAGDTWTWDGHSWSRVDHDPTPPGRRFPAVVWDPGNSSMIIYGGSGLNPEAGGGGAGTPLADGWLLKNGSWTQIKSPGPPALTQANSLWETGTKRALILFGMACPNPTDAVWAWDGAAWSQGNTPTVPARWGAAAAQDSVGKALLFGGSNESGC